MTELSSDDKSTNEPDLIINDIHLGRGDRYIDTISSLSFHHKTTEIKRWRISDKDLIETDPDDGFYSHETYIVQWHFTTSTYHHGSDDQGRLEVKKSGAGLPGRAATDLLSENNNQVYFYWRGDQATKGYSPLPESIEKDNPPVERIVQWSEPPAFLRLFSGSFVVHLGRHDTLSDEPHLYILRGEIEEEAHLYEVTLDRSSLRSRTSFVLHRPKDKSSVIWHGSSSRSRTLTRSLTLKIFGEDFEEVEEDQDNGKFLDAFPASAHFRSKGVEHTPKLFYFNDVTDQFLMSEVECSHRSEHLTPFPFLQAHLYTAIQPATFLLDDGDEIWIWQGWQREDEDENFKAECFAKALDYAKEKSKTTKKLVKVQKVAAGFEPEAFTNLFPTWTKREDVVQLQKQDGLLPNTLIEVISEEDSSKLCCPSPERCYL